MISRVKFQLYAHDLRNPPTEGTTCDINLKLTNSNDRLKLTKVSPGFQTLYLLSIPEAHHLGLLSSEQNKIDLFKENLILAANLILHKTALSARKSDLNVPEVEYKQQESKVIEEETSKGKHITITNTVIVTDKVEVMIGFTEEIDESMWVSILQQINTLSIKKLQNSTQVPLINLKKSFNEYRNAMEVIPDRLIIFKHLFNALELASNFDGKDLKGLEFDNEVARITKLQASEVREWRCFYDRTKHVDRTSRDMATFMEGIKKLPEILLPLRVATQAVILDRLKAVLL